MATIYQDKAEIPSVPETFLYDYEAAADTLWVTGNQKLFPNES